MSEKAVVSGVELLWSHVFDLHTAVRRGDIAEIASILIVFPSSPETAGYEAAAGDYMHALARLSEPRSPINEIVLDSYRDTYMKAYSDVIGGLAAAQSPAGPAGSPA